jgi:hypothetical protein
MIVSLSAKVNMSESALNVEVIKTVRIELWTGGMSADIFASSDNPVDLNIKNIQHAATFGLDALWLRMHNLTLNGTLEAPSLLGSREHILANLRWVKPAIAPIS